MWSEVAVSIISKHLDNVCFDDARLTKPIERTVESCISLHLPSRHESDLLRMPARDWEASKLWHPLGRAVASAPKLTSSKESIIVICVAVLALSAFIFLKIAKRTRGLWH